MSYQWGDILGPNPRDDDLVPVARTDILGLGINQRGIQERIERGDFPKVIKVRGRRYITWKQLQDYKRDLIEGKYA